jgi:hypothetical protein
MMSFVTPYVTLHPSHWRVAGGGWRAQYLGRGGFGALD